MLTNTRWCSSLKTFYCNNTQLTTLDVSHLDALIVLLCYNNQFSTLDIPKNTKLKHLDCSGNKLTKLNVSYNRELVWLYCNGNQLSALDASLNTTLKYLHCNDNQLATLNVSKNAELAEIYCYNNQLQGEYMDAFINSLPVNTTDEVHILRILTDEEDEGNVCTKAQVAAIKAKGWTPYWKSNGEWVEYAGSIEGYEINEENFPDENFRNYLLQQPYGEDEFIYLAEIDNITYMDVSGRNISSLQGIEHFTALMQLLCGNNKLTTLDVSQNTELTHLGCDSNQLTALNVSENTKLIWLYCHSNKLTTLDVSNNTELRYLHCYDNQLTTLDVSNNTELKSLECYNNNISGYAMDTFISSLPMNTGSEPQPLRLLTDDMDEGNYCTMDQAQAFKAKGWTPMVRIEGVWVEYDEATAITLLNAETEDDDNAEYYTLDGVRVDKPTKKGIYIKNGKKVVIK